MAGFEVTPEGAIGTGLAVKEATSASTRVALAALAVWDLVSSKLNLRLSAVEATVFWILWTISDEQQNVSAAGLLTSVNVALEAQGLPSLSNNELDNALDKLDSMKCVERIGPSPAWHLLESVRLEYS
jgi:hypothetical protein